MRLAICGPARSGKDTASVWFREHTRLRYIESTSQAGTELVFQALRHKYNYATAEECFDDRFNHRLEWAKLIWNYNQPDGMRLYRLMLLRGDILNGIRRPGELQACKEHGLLDLTIWIDRPGATESQSLEFGPEACDIAIMNHGTLEEFYAKLASLAAVLGVLKT